MPIEDFIQDLELAKRNIEKAIRRLKREPIMIGHKRRLEGNLEAIITKLTEIQKECEKPKPTEEELRRELEILRSIVEM